MKKTLLLGCSLILANICTAQTLQSVTTSGATTNLSIQVGGGPVNTNTTKVYINNSYGKKFALSAGANYLTEQGFHIFNWTDNQDAPYFSITNAGNVGIGSYMPGQLLGIVSPSAPTTIPALGANGGQFALLAGTGAGAYGFISGSLNNGNVYQQVQRIDGTATAYNLLFQPNGGNVGIGTTNPTEKLVVAGKINAREIKVLATAGADFVFADDYQLPSLQMIEAYVKKNKHLPEIAPAAEMVANGVELGELNIKLLQKVEELTLHLIEKEKAILAQQEQIASQQKQIDEILKSLTELKKK